MAENKYLINNLLFTSDSQNGRLLANQNMKNKAAIEQTSEKENIVREIAII